MSEWDGTWRNDPFDMRGIRLDAEMEIERSGTECIKKVENPVDPCGLCKHYGFCFKAPSEKRESEEDE